EISQVCNVEPRPGEEIPSGASPWLRMISSANVHAWCRSVGEAAHDLLGERKRAGQPRRLDAEEVNHARKPVLRRPFDHEIGGRLARARQLRPDAAIVRSERVVPQPPPVVPNALDEPQPPAG